MLVHVYLNGYLIWIVCYMYCIDINEISDELVCLFLFFFFEKKIKKFQDSFSVISLLQQIRKKKLINYCLGHFSTENTLEKIKRDFQKE